MNSLNWPKKYSALYPTRLLNFLGRALSQLGGILSRLFTRDECLAECTVLVEYSLRVNLG